MAKDNKELIIREYALKNNQGPDGKRWGITTDANGWGLFCLGQLIAERDGTEKVDTNKVPTELHGFFTSQHKAQAALEVYLRKFWDMSDEASKRGLEKSVV